MDKKGICLKDTFGGKVISHHEIEANFQKVKDWLSDCGINISNSRYRHCLHLLFNRDEVSWDKLWANVELHDLVDIYENLRSLKSSNLLVSLKTSVKGPVLLSEEPNTGGAIHGRNFTFELYTASRLARAGFNVEFDTEADVNFNCLNKLIHTECKRVSSSENLDKLVKKAHKQIANRCNKYGGVGLVSISISKLVYIASTTDENGNQREEYYADFQDIQQRMRLLVGKFSQMFKLAFGHLEPRCVGLLMHYKMPFVDRKTNAMSFLNRFSMVAYENSDHNKAIAQNISNAMSESVNPGHN